MEKISSLNSNSSQTPFNLFHNPNTNATLGGVDGSTLGLIDLETIYGIYFTNIALSLFEWKDLPDTMNSEFLEYTLFLDGSCSLVYDKTLGFINTRYSYSNNINMYMLPTSIKAYSIGYNQEFNSDDDFVICRNTLAYTPTMLFVNYFSDKISKVQKVIDINLEAQKTPVLLQGTKDQKMSLVNLFEKYENGVPFIFGEKGISELISVLKTDAPFLADKLIDIKQKYMSEFLTFMGINNVADTSIKKERLIEDEVNANNEFITMNFETMYLCRKNACDEFNRKFKDKIEKPISCEPRIESNLLLADTPSGMVNMGSSEMTITNPEKNGGNE